MTPSPLGVPVIEAALATLPDLPGVYRMIDRKGGVLYVGKALSLKKRVAYYTKPPQLPERLVRMVSDTAQMEIITTRTEAEALLLEASLIKSLKPRYNILLRDDKSYPWILLTEGHPYPQIEKYRGARPAESSVWGPFASAWSVNQTLQLLQRLFKLRSCSDEYFKSRTRPCLLAQIGRCSAPCVGRIAAPDYAKLVKQAKSYLSGRITELQKSLSDDMTQAALALEFEQAAQLRDRLQALAYVTRTDSFSLNTLGDADIIGAHPEGGQAAIQVFFIRHGLNHGNRCFFPTSKGETLPEIISAFLVQFYEDKSAPPLILLGEDLPETKLIEEALTVTAKQKVTLQTPRRGDKFDLVQRATENARDALTRKLQESATQRALFEQLEDITATSPINRIEIYDNSHLMGTFAYGVMVAATRAGFLKTAYRKYKIENPAITSDDFSMMREVFSRRFRNYTTESDLRAEDYPELLLIDGGAGQLSAVHSALAELGVDDITVLAIAKGVDRNAGREWFHMQGREPFQLPFDSPALFFLQRLRDEAHRFAITTHRAARGKAVTVSELEDVPGIGAKRKKALLTHFGSVKAIKGATMEQLEAVIGINRATAKVIFGYFHPEAQRGE
ncbi:excinuclease ABC subunit UvrC [Acidocella sp.]|uniref:excinuclease ABC subunit UvrC n=1 Tax=Acidocella sp. TaxID=50710 RepID=UPI002630C1E2|nr:excinuclease ABC subunit UvrC [Acidocella sp.]